MLTKEDDKYLKSQSKLLKSILDPEDIPNKCSECEHAYIERNYLINGNDYQGCRLNSKVVNAYGCSRELLGQHGEGIPNYPDDDPMDLAKDKFIKKHMRGEH